MTQQEWEPGTVAMVTDGRGEYLALRRTSGATSYWVGNVRHATDGKVTSVRPLLVLDPDDPDQMRELVDNFFVALSGRAYRNYARDIDDMRAAVVTMLPKPTPVKPAEPTGLGAVVMDYPTGRSETWVLIYVSDYPEIRLWRRCGDGEERTTWAKFSNAVKVLSEGVTT